MTCCMIAASASNKMHIINWFGEHFDKKYFRELLVNLCDGNRYKMLIDKHCSCHCPVLQNYCDYSFTLVKNCFCDLNK